jgi:hypothetical protein
MLQFGILIFDHTYCKKTFAVGVSDPDPHSIDFLDPDPHSKCRSGSRSVKSAKIERKTGAKTQKMHHKKLTEWMKPYLRQ